MKKRNRRRVQINERDIKLFLFLWRWKLGTTAAIARKFFKSSGPNIAYNRLLLLKNNSFLEIVPLDSDSKRFVWTLAKKGFSVLKNRLPALKEAGYKSDNIEHDFLVTAMHLGEWLVEPLESVHFFTEQELRRYALDHYPDWVPLTELHRPDGYWLVPYNTNMVAIALEVELTQKRNADYEVLALFYKERPQIGRVVWCVPTKTMAKNIQTIFRDEVKDDCLKHDFIILEDFENLFWHAPICLGYEQGKRSPTCLAVKVTGPWGGSWGSPWGPHGTP